MERNNRLIYDVYDFHCFTAGDESTLFILEHVWSLFS